MNYPIIYTFADGERIDMKKLPSIYIKSVTFVPERDVKKTLRESIISEEQITTYIK